MEIIEALKTNKSGNLRVIMDMNPVKHAVLIEIDKINKEHKIRIKEV